MLERLRRLVSPPRFTSATLVDRIAELHRDRVLLTLDQPLGAPGADHQAWTAVELQELVARVAGALARRLAVVPGERIGLVREQDADVLVLALALLRLGAVVVPVDPADARELVALLEGAHLDAIVADDATLARFEGTAVRAALDGRILSAGPGLAAVLAEDAPLGEPAEIAGDAPAVVFLAAHGSTARAIVLDSDALVLRARALQLLRFPAGTVGVSAIAPAQPAGLLSMTFALLAGLPVHYVRRFDPERVLALLEDRRASAFLGTPEQYRRMAEVGLDRHRLDGVRFWLSAGERMPLEQMREFQRRGAVLGLGRLRAEAVFVDASGSVELAGAALLRFSPPGRGDGTLVGVPIPPYRVRVCDEAGRELRRGEVGGLWIAGPGLGDAVPDLARTSDGWVRTGEHGLQEMGGLLRLIDRSSDVIRTGLYAVLPVELERVLAEHPQVARAVAFGVPHPTKREMPVAVVVAAGDGPAPEAAELLAWARQRLVDHKAPRRIWLVTDQQASVPRAALRERYWNTFA